MLDGGQVIMHTLESLKGSALPDDVLQLSFRISILLVATIFVFVTYNDLIRLFGRRLRVMTFRESGLI